MLAHLVRDYTQQVPGIGMVRIHFQNLPVDRLGLAPMARLMVLQHHSQSFGNCRHIFERMKDEG